jgi:signal transduction histidine kinase
MIGPTEHILTPPPSLGMVPRAVALLGIGGLAIAIGAAVILRGWPAATTVALFAFPALALFLAARYVAVLADARRTLEVEVERLRARPDAAALDPAGFAHDLRSPLLTVCMHLEMIAADAFGPLPAAARDSIEVAARASRRAQALVDSMLRPASPAATSSAPVDVAAVLAEVSASLSADIAVAGARIEAGALPVVPADEAAVYRILENLVQNALRYGRPGESPRVEVDALDAGDAWVLSVRDWGLGIAPSERERVFERATRGKGSLGTPGYGLGLATVRALAEELGGSASIDAAVTDGTRVLVTLPRWGRR